MSNNATVRMGVDDTKVQTGVTKVKAGLKAMSDAAQAESAKAMAAMKAISALELKQSRAASAGDKTGAAAIQREIDLAKELESIRRKAATESDRIILQTQARQRKNLADEMAVTQRKRAELDEINKIAAKSLAIKQQAHQVDVKSVALSNIRAGGGQSVNFRGQRMANIGAQLQDVAVQAQMGARWSTIIAQQGPQLVSALGGTGKMAGIAAGVGIATAVSMALVDMVVKSNESFKNMTKGAADFRKELRSIVDGGTTGDIVTAIGNGSGKMEELKKLGEEMSGFWATAGGHLGHVFAGHQSTTDKAKQNAQDLADAYWDLVAANDKMLKLSHADVELEKTKLTASKEQLALLDEDKNLRIEIAKIKGDKNLTDESRGQREQDAYSKSHFRRQGIEKRANEDRAKSAQDFIDSIEEDERKSAERRAKIEKQVAEAKIEGEQAGAMIGKSDEEAEQMRNGITLAKELAKINEMNASQESRNALATAAIKKATAANELIAEKKKKEIADANQKAAERDGEERAATGKLLQDAEDASIEAQQKKYSLSERIALETAKLAKAEAEAAHQAKFGSKANQNTANAKVLTTRLSLQELAQERAAQFVGKSSADVRRADRDEAKQKKELDKAGRRAIEADIRKADAENRRATAKNPFGLGGLTDAQKKAMREAGNKALGKDLQVNAADRAAKSLENIETDMKEMKQKLGVAK